MTKIELEHLEAQLADFDPAARRAALEELASALRAGRLASDPPRPWVNLHLHTFFSYNALGDSPSRVAWRARGAGLAVAGIVDFDVLDGLDEFFNAARALDLKAVVGLETRVYVPAFADRVINSPGEPGIAYHMGVGFPRSSTSPDTADFFQGLRRMSEQRNRGLVERVNRALSPVILDYDRDVLPLTPSGNATERHICLAYARKAAAVFPEHGDLADFWSARLDADAHALELPEGRLLQDRIRARTMKRGGAGYVQPDQGSFPTLAEANRFFLAAGALPTLTWLDGSSAGEQAIDELFEESMSSGVAALNIIPDRNYTPGVVDDRLRHLREVVQIAQQRHLPVFVGTEMNSPGQKFIDNFESAELQPLTPVFYQGAHIAYAHSVLQRMASLGYTSPWAREHFPKADKRMLFFEEVGRRLVPRHEERLRELTADVTPPRLLAMLTES